VSDDNLQLNGRHWAFDKRIPVAMILAIIAQSGAFVWAAATLWERVSVLEKRTETLGTTNDRLIHVEDTVTNLSTRMEERTAAVQADVRSVGYEVRQLASRFYLPVSPQVGPPQPMSIPIPQTPAPLARPPHDP
jgi:hypothetical protein